MASRDADGRVRVCSSRSPPERIYQSDFPSWRVLARVYASRHIKNAESGSVIRVVAKVLAELWTAQAKAPKGTGIGLYLCRVLVEQMKGSIGFRDRKGGCGSVFWFTLPILRQRPQAQAALLDSKLAGG